MCCEAKAERMTAILHYMSADPYSHFATLGGPIANYVPLVGSATGITVVGVPPMPLVGEAKVMVMVAPPVGSKPVPLPLELPPVPLGEGEKAVVLPPPPVD